jgi:protein-S-isoprenylcysteine O-methyltransferase Ste14
MIWLYKAFFPVVWITFLIYWRIKAANTKSTQRLESGTSGILRILTILVAIILLSTTWIPVPWLYQSVWRAEFWPFWMGAALTVCGLLFSVWAREHLGRNWSSQVSIKQDHELITSGPYGVVRPPYLHWHSGWIPRPRDCSLPGARIHRFRALLRDVLGQAEQRGTVDALSVWRDVCQVCSSDQRVGALPLLSACVVGF